MEELLETLEFGCKLDGGIGVVAEGGERIAKMHSPLQLLLLQTSQSPGAFRMSGVVREAATED